MEIKDHIKTWYSQWLLIDHLYSKFASKYHLTLASFEVLLEMYYYGECFSQKQLIAKLGVPKQTLSNIMKGLESKGLMKRKLSTEDKRLYVFELTTLGVEFCKEMFDKVEGIEYGAFGRLSEEERNLFTKINVKLTHFIEEGMFNGGNDGN